MATRVEDLTLLFQVGEGLKKEQMRTIFEAIAACRPGKLKRLFLGFGSNLHELDADVLAAAVNNLECFIFNWRSFLTVQQAERILSLLLRRGRTRTLKRLCIWVLGYRHASHLDRLATEAKKFTDISIEESCLSDTRASDSSESDSDQDQDSEKFHEWDFDN